MNATMFAAVFMVAVSLLRTGALAQSSSSCTNAHVPMLELHTRELVVLLSASVPLPGGGSKTVPTTGDGTSAGNSAKQSFPVVFFMAASSFVSIERVRRSFDNSASCPDCLSDMESTIHALRDCKEAREGGPVDVQDGPVDGAVHSNTDMGSIGGLARDNNGNWIIGFYQSLGTATALNTELWTIYTGLQLAKDKGLKHVLIQSDCMEAVTAIYETIASSSSNSLCSSYRKTTPRKLGHRNKMDST
ncbi:hypothetical protein V6N12_066392 [Hibiscus sabdariffa]|uniref:Plant heme peroxidase family profile domain-containing protein n=1 Tax=Hibiscus sabdariffa TaxID=183260 RepID=A0ABR2CQG9_9ROSI